MKQFYLLAALMLCDCGYLQQSRDRTGDKASSPNEIRQSTADTACNAEKLNFYNVIASMSRSCSVDADCSLFDVSRPYGCPENAAIASATANDDSTRQMLDKAGDAVVANCEHIQLPCAPPRPLVAKCKIHLCAREEP